MYPLSIGYVALKVRDLQTSLQFYTEKIGLRILTNTGETATLTADGVNSLLQLQQLSSGSERPQRSTGLYHFALLVPTRTDLGHAFRHLLEQRVPLQGASDHGFSEAIYLADPDGNGIEIYADKAEAEWPRRADGSLDGYTKEMDVQGVLASAPATPFTALPTQTIIGHIHLNVESISGAKQFYVDTLGFETMMYYGEAALFVASGGYHHHLGLNVWNRPNELALPSSLGLDYFTIRTTEQQLTTLTDTLRHTSYKVETRENGLLVTDNSQLRVMFTIHPTLS